MSGRKSKTKKEMGEDITNTKMMPLRIYVGGLGERVAENEVSRIFESVGGVVEGVELVRTKGRSFAYVDFLPSSNKSLSKLFGTVLAFYFFIYFLLHYYSAKILIRKFIYLI